jgi:hypothetical protein
MDKQLFDHDPDSGITQWFIPSSDGKQFTIQTTQRVEDTIEANRERYNSFDRKANWKGDMHHVARIPIQLYYQLKKKGITESDASMKAWLNSPENLYFRTRPGRV